MIDPPRIMKYGIFDLNDREHPIMGSETYEPMLCQTNVKNFPPTIKNYVI